jgi:hypothetical protein
MQPAELREQRFELDAAVRGRKWLQTPHRLCQLPLRADLAPTSGLVPGDGDVHQALEEVALLGGRGAPGILELLVRGEVLARTNQLDARLIRGLELLRLPPGRRTCGAGSRGRTRAGLCARRTASRARGT